jgi:hypothetical protein
MGKKRVEKTTLLVLYPVLLENEINRSETLSQNI